MRTRIIFQILFLSSLILSCDENDPEKFEERDFVPGDIAIGIKSTVAIDLVFNLMNERGVFIEQMSGFFNYSRLPNDSLEYIKDILKSKPYTDRWGGYGGSAFISAVDNRLIVTEFFFNMDIPAQEDWLSTMNQLELKDLGNDTKNLLINVSPGTERYWMNVFKKHQYVKWVELNYIGGHEPLN